MLKRLKESVKKLKQEIVPIYYALFDSRTPLLAKVIAGLTVAYLLSPIDLIPDFIPVLGLLDDLLIVPLLIRITIKLIPKSVMDDIKSKIGNKEKLSKRWYYAIPIIILYACALLMLYQQISKMAVFCTFSIYLSSIGAA